MWAPLQAMGIGLYRQPGVAVSPASLAYLRPEMLANYSQAAQGASACATPRERRWALVVCAAFVILAPLLIGLGA